MKDTKNGFYRIGEVFECTFENGSTEKLRCIEQKADLVNGCSRCDLHKTELCLITKCSCVSRVDRQNVIFRKVQNV